MGNKKPDRRVLKTKKAIRNAFVKLLSQKDYNSISIKDIADTADVDRKTVYNYYAGIHAIREELENDLVALWNDSVQNVDFVSDIRNPRHIFDSLTQILNGNFELCGNLMKLDSNSDIFRKFVTALEKLICSQLTQIYAGKHSVAKLNVTAKFVASGLLSAYQSWFNSDHSAPLDDLSQTLGDLVLCGIKSLD